MTTTAEHRRETINLRNYDEGLLGSSRQLIGTRVIVEAHEGPNYEVREHVGTVESIKGLYAIVRLDDGRWQRSGDSLVVAEV